MRFSWRSLLVALGYIAGLMIGGILGAMLGQQLSIRGARRQLMLTTGWLLFAIGGFIPFIWRIGSLPIFLLAASAVEIFFQNFLTGVVAARLLGIEEAPALKAT